MSQRDPFAGFDLEGAISTQARALGLALDAGSVAALAAHARAVARAPHELHLTSIRDPRSFVERHIGESLAGARFVEAGARLLDLGSGNGYPGLALLLARPAASGVLAEASPKRAGFLRALCASLCPRAKVLDRQVQRAADLGELQPLDVLTSRAVGGWERILPRLAAALVPGGRVLLWAGTEVEEVARRAAWSRLEIEAREPLPGRDRSFLWVFRRP